MKHLSWSTLRPAWQTRFLRAARADDSTAPLLFIPLTISPSFSRRLLFLGAGLLATGYSWTVGFGLPGTADALETGFVVPIVGLALVGYVVAAWLAGVSVRTSSGLPPGTYIFATHVVELIKDSLFVRATEDLRAFDARPVPDGIAISLRFPDGDIRLSLPRTERTEKQLSRCASILRATALARQRGDRDWLNARSPLGQLDSIQSGPSGSITRPITTAQVMGVLIGALWGGVGSMVRGHLSDTAVVRTILETPTTESWRWYISGNGARANEAQTTWLPAAVKAEDDDEFRMAVMAGTVQGFRDYLTKYTLHAAEVNDTWLPEAALKEAVASSSIASLRAFQREFAAESHATLRAEAARQIAARYEEALARLVAQVPPKDRALRRYFERLFLWLGGSSDGQVDVVFSPPATANLAAIDRLYRRVYSGTCNNVQSLETNFSPSALAGSEWKVFDGLSRALQQVVSNEALHLVQVDSRESESRPKIAVAYTVTSSGGVFVDDDEKDADHATDCYIGTRIRYDVRMSIPGERTQYSFTVNVVPPDRFEVSSTTASWLPSRAGVSAIKVYDRMTALGFERLAEGLRQRLFDPSSSAYDEMFKMLDAESR